MSIQYDKTLDLRGAQCPMPLVEGSKAVKALQAGEVLKVVAHAPGSMAIQGLTSAAKNVEQITEESIQEDGLEVFVHYLRRNN
jgi:TusA-related sulfurtransferase